ncbi:DUF983 domain-containing protein [Sphingobium sp. DEHP117]|uniref:DUF983 domain-containing protein n=1 Tax=Sphingobium sp. DEHP117 TaxID=2993436 RepID=UPI0027D734A4|nr:DUF983 domain-containing protein [Sphingobium sp. DEHP117]MDQ4418932.1 DUF983 domain-containing protein [Sphingobium sp. DEHP117]
MTDQATPPAPLLLASAKGLCPRCGAQTLFVSPVRFADGCRMCGLDYRQFNVGDGPAAFLTLIVGGLILGLALALEFSVHPPLVVHLLLWPVLTVACVVGSLRVAKAMLLTLEYKNKAAEGVLAKPADPRDGGDA